MFGPATTEMRSLWRVLGTRRATPFLPLLDLPSAVVEREQLVRLAARAAFEELERQTGNHGPADPQGAVDASIGRFKEGLGEVLPDDRSALDAWIERFHADLAQKVRWEIWSQVLSIALTDHAFADERGLPENLTRAIRAAVIPRLGAEAWRQVDRIREQSDATRLDASEAARLRLEVGATDNMPYIDVAEYMEYLLGLVRSRAAVAELFASLSGIERRQVTDWAVAVARWRGRSDEQAALLRKT